MHQRIGGILFCGIILLGGERIAQNFAITGTGQIVRKPSFRRRTLILIAAHAQIRFDVATGLHFVISVDAQYFLNYVAFARYIGPIRRQTECKRIPILTLYLDI